jgi:hypothetical protein
VLAEALYWQAVLIFRVCNMGLTANCLANAEHVLQQSDVLLTVAQQLSGCQLLKIAAHSLHMWCAACHWRLLHCHSTPHQPPQGRTGRHCSSSSVAAERTGCSTAAAAAAGERGCIPVGASE